MVKCSPSRAMVPEMKRKGRMNMNIARLAIAAFAATMFGGASAGVSSGASSRSGERSGASCAAAGAAAETGAAVLSACFPSFP